MAEVPATLFSQTVGRTMLPHYAWTLREGGSPMLWGEIRRLLGWVGLLTLGMIGLTGLVWWFDLRHLLGEVWLGAFALFPWLIIGVGARLGCHVAAQSLVARGMVEVDSRFKLQESAIYLTTLPLLVWTWSAQGAVVGFMLMYVVALMRRIRAARDGDTRPVLSPKAVYR